MLPSSRSLTPSIVDNCCGNNICEASDTSECPEECSTSLSTTYCNSCIYAVSNYFMIEATTDITITSMTVFLYLSDPGTIQVYKRDGDCAGYLSSEGNWDLQQEFSVTTSSTFTKQVLIFDNPISISAGLHSFYIHAGTHYLLASQGTSELSVHSSNDHLMIFEGGLSNGLFGGTASPWVWGGSIDYEIVPVSFMTLCVSVAAHPQICLSLYSIPLLHSL